ncbi:MAG: hypothetical protein K9L28_11330 [Synergistales bacterium]|nr:hypothetical protein [Synergistales bacterium]
MDDFKNAVNVVKLLTPQDIAGADTTSDYIDLAEYNGVVVVAEIGALTGADASNTITPVLQEADTTTGSDFIDVAAADMEGTFATIDDTAEDEVVQFAGYLGNKRYLRMSFEHAGTSISAALVSSVAIVGKPYALPCPAPTTGSPG